MECQELEVRAGASTFASRPDAMRWLGPVLGQGVIVDLDWSPADLAFRDEVRGFLDEKLTDDLRRAGRLATSVYPDHEASMQWQHILHARGWAAPRGR